MLLTIEYCAHFPEDTGCPLFVPHFERKASMAADLEVHVPTVTVSAAARFVPAACKCGDPCAATFDVTAVSAADGFLVVEFFVPSTVGTYNLCVSPIGLSDAASFALFVAEVDVTPAGCVFDSAAADGPCASGGVCELDPQSEACQLVLASYCASHPEDLACALLVPSFDRVLGSPVTLEINYAGAAAGVTPALSTCGCSEICDFVAAEVLAVTSESEVLILAIQSEMPAAGVSICLMRSRSRVCLSQRTAALSRLRIGPPLASRMRAGMQTARRA
jgi:hypothetical protein